MTSGHNCPTQDNYSEDYDSLLDDDEQRPEKQCGAYNIYADPNGKIKVYRMWCKDFRNCAVCLMRRSKEFRARVTTACARAEESGESWPQWQTMPEADAPAFRQKLKRHGIKLWRAPVAGERIIVFYQHDDTIASGRNVTVQDLAIEQGLDWERIATTPLRRRTSGKLGQPVEKERPEDSILVELPVTAIPSYLTKAQVEECEIKAHRATADLDPSVDEAVEACALVTKALQVELEAAAVEYYISQGDDQGTAELNAFRDTPLSTIKRYWSPSSFEPWTNDEIMSTDQTTDDKRSRYSTRALPGVDFIPAPVELML